MLDVHDMNMPLPPAVPTLEALNSKNLTRPDNIFCTPNLSRHITVCRVLPLERPTKTDHFPIALEINITPARTIFVPRKDYRVVDWDELRDALRGELNTLPAPDEINTVEDFNTRLLALQSAIHRAEENHIPLSKNTPYRNRWWSNNLKTECTLVRQLAKKAWQARGIPTSEIHQEYRNARNQYGDNIRKAKEKFWIGCLEGAVSEGADMWKASRMMTRKSMDGGQARIPNLHIAADNGTTRVATDNKDKARVLCNTFFPPPPTSTNVPNDPDYPAPAWKFKSITDEQVERTFKNMKPDKATFPDSLHNNFMRATCDIIAPYYAPLYRATFTLKYYPDTWKETLTIVLKKPGKDNYHKPEAWRPIVLSKGEARALNKCVAEDITWGCEKYNLLPMQHYGGRPGRRAVDAILGFVTKVKEAWRNHKVATAIFLDVKGAFPSTDVDRLQYDLRMTRIPKQYTQWVGRRLTGRKTRLTFDDYQSEQFEVTSGLDQGDPVSGILYIIYNAEPARHIHPRRGEHNFLYIDDNTILVTAPNFTEAHRKCAELLHRPNGPFDWASSHNCQYSIPKFQALDLVRPCLGNTKRCIGKGTTITVHHSNETYNLKPQKTARWLGMIVDEDLCWQAQIERLTEAGEEWVNKFQRLAKVSGGVVANKIRNFYEAIAIP